MRLDWIRFIVVWAIVIFSVYSIYAYYSKDTTTINTEEPKIKLTNKQLQEIKHNFSVVDLNFSNRVIHTKEGSTIERIK